jgi:hypothetical protein
MCEELSFSQHMPELKLKFNILVQFVILTVFQTQCSKHRNVIS